MTDYFEQRYGSYLAYLWSQADVVGWWYVVTDLTEERDWAGAGPEVVGLLDFLRSIAVYHAEGQGVKA